jgi:hypothetical protein
MIGNKRLGIAKDQQRNPRCLHIQEYSYRYHWFSLLCKRYAIIAGQRSTRINLILDLNTSSLENVFSQVHHTNCDTTDTIKKGLIAVSLNEQECKMRGNNKCLVHLYSSLYGGDHQADEKGGDTFIGNQVVKQECKFPSLIMS